MKILTKYILLPGYFFIRPQFLIIYSCSCVIYKDIFLHFEIICNLFVSRPSTLIPLFSFLNIGFSCINLIALLVKNKLSNHIIENQINNVWLEIMHLRYLRVKFKLISWSTTFSKSYHGEDDLIIFSCIQSRLCKFNFCTG